MSSELNYATYIPFLKANEEHIQKNLEQLEKQEWFQKLIQDKDYKNLTLHNPKVRQVIGKFNTQKLEKETYSRKCQVKLYNILLKVSYVPVD